MAAARAGRSLVMPAKIPELMMTAIIGFLIGGRLGSYLVYDVWRTFTTDPLWLLRVWDPGMASHGGMVGVAVALACFARAQRVPFLHLGDIITSAATARVADRPVGELYQR
jgi:phosphatidylglycerol---prolipoprotein diacylglyceryl transferase